VRGEAQNYMKLFVADKMAGNDPLNKVHVAAATDLPQLLSQNTNTFGEATAQSRSLTLRSYKNKFLEVGGGHVPQCLIAGDANGGE